MLCGKAHQNQKSRAKGEGSQENTKIQKYEIIRLKIQSVQVVEEINLLKKFSNPHIIRFIEAFENPGEVILIRYKYKYKYKYKHKYKHKYR